MASSKITIIMSVKNDEKTLNRALESIFNQTYTNFKIIIIDDNSQDETSDILKKYSSKYSNLNIITNKRSLGLGKNLNTMLNIADTPYIARMDGDDICESSRLETQLQFLENNLDIDIVGTCAYIIDQDDNITGEMNRPEYHLDIRRAIWRNPVIHPSIMMRREQILSIGGYPEYKRRQDYALWFKAIKNDLRFHNLQSRLIRYRVTRSHYKKMTFRETLKQIYIGWRGYASIGGINPIHYMIMMWPLIRHFLPTHIQIKLQYILKQYDQKKL